MKFLTKTTRCLALGIFFIGGGVEATAQTVTPSNTSSQSCQVTPGQMGMQYTYNPGSSGLAVQSWEVLGDLTPGAISGNTITVNSTSANGKGRVKANLSNCSAAVYDVFKSFTVADDIVGPPCPAAGSQAAFTIEPSVSSITQISAGIGIDTYQWTINGAVIPTNGGVYNATFSGDRSAMTITVPSTSFVVGVTVGSCNVGMGRERTLPVSVGLPAISFSTPLPSSCRSVYDNSAFTLSVANPPSGATYVWTAPSGWTITYGDATRTTATITPTNANSGDVVVTGQLGTGAPNACNSRTAVFHVDRQLEQVAGTTKNYITSSTGAVTCYSAGTSYTFTLNGLIPGGNLLTWTVPSGWNITSANGGSVITAVPGPLATSGNVTVNTTSCPAGVVARPVTISGAVAQCDYSITNISNPFFWHSYGAGPVPGNTCDPTGTTYTWRLLSPTGTVLESSVPRPHPQNTYQFLTGGGAPWPTPGYTVEVRVQNTANCLDIVRTAVNQQRVATANTAKAEASPVAGEARVYPNPSNDVVNIELPEAAKGVAQVIISDALGRVQQRLTTTATWTPVSVVKLPAGSYTVRVLLPDGTRTTRALMINH